MKTKKLSSFDGTFLHFYQIICTRDEAAEYVK